VSLIHYLVCCSPYFIENPLSGKTGVTNNDYLLVGVILSFLSSMATLAWMIYIQKNKLPVENRKTESDTDLAQASTAESYARAADIQARRFIEIAKRLEDAERRIDDLERREKDYNLMIDDLKDWVERLCHQIQMLGSVPVEMRKRAPR